MLENRTPDGTLLTLDIRRKATGGLRKRLLNALAIPSTTCPILSANVDFMSVVQKLT
jgi:hypothetical protein